MSGGFLIWSSEMEEVMCILSCFLCTDPVLGDKNGAKRVLDKVL